MLRSAGSQVSYSLQRGASPPLGDPDLAPAPAAQRALATAVAALVAPNGGEAVNQGQELAQFDIGFVLLPAPVNQDLARLLDGVAGLRPVSSTPAFDLWRLSRAGGPGSGGWSRTEPPWPCDPASSASRARRYPRQAARWSWPSQPEAGRPRSTGSR